LVCQTDENAKVTTEKKRKVMTVNNWWGGKHLKSHAGRGRYDNSQVVDTSEQKRGTGGSRVEGNNAQQNPIIQLYLSLIFVLNY
jgi:hypothetical protein